MPCIILKENRTLIARADNLVSTTIAARLLAIKPVSVRLRCRKGTLPAVRVGKLWKIDRAALVL